MERNKKLSFNRTKNTRWKKIDKISKKTKRRETNDKVLMEPKILVGKKMTKSTKKLNGETKKRSSDRLF